jgi:hypothetical protein
VAAFGGQRFLTFPDDELKIVCVRAYNDFLRDWASADHRRLITIMTTPFWDVAEAVREVERCADDVATRLQDWLIDVEAIEVGHD